MPEDQKQERISTPEEEIQELEEKLEEKKKELAKKGEAEKEEKEVFREVLKEHISAVQQPTQSVTPTLKPAAPTDDIKKREEREAEIRELIEIALTKTIQEAVRIAERTTPYLLDELHDHLADDYYDKLIALRKIKQF